MRNVLHDWKLPIFSIIGYRSYLNQDTLPGDTCLVFTEPMLDAWKIDYRLHHAPRSDRRDRRALHARASAANAPGAIVDRRGEEHERERMPAKDALAVVHERARRRRRRRSPR